MCVALYTVHSHCDLEKTTVFALQTTSEPGISSSLMSPDTGDSRARAQNKCSVLSAVIIRDARSIGFWATPTYSQFALKSG